MNKYQPKTQITWWCRVAPASCKPATHNNLQHLFFQEVVSCCAADKLLQQHTWPHSIYFSFAGVSAGKLTAAAHTQNESHFKLLTQAPRQRGGHYEPGKATTARQGNRAVKEEQGPRCSDFCNPTEQWPSFFPNWAISSALILDSHIA